MLANGGMLGLGRGPKIAGPTPDGPNGGTRVAAAVGATLGDVGACCPQAAIDATSRAVFAAASHRPERAMPR
jgi:hypothetical protein